MLDVTALSLSRRGLLLGAAGAALTLAGCTTGAPAGGGSAEPDPFAVLLAAHVALAAAYDAALLALGGDPRLVAMRANLTEQIATLAKAAGSTEPTRTTAAPTTTPAPDPGALLAAVRDEQAAVGTACHEQALAERDLDRVPLLASLSAAHRCAATVLA